MISFQVTPEKHSYMATLPDNFVYVRDINPTILETIRYGTYENFVGRPIRGYGPEAGAILTYPAAQALSRVQEEILVNNFSLVIYDAYRPQKAVNNFITWSQELADQKMQKYYYPRTEKKEFFSLGYLSKQSGHSRGSTVDLTLIPASQTLRKVEDIVSQERTLQDGFKIMYLDDGTLDMGSSFDLFDEASHHDSTLFEAQYLDRRNYLRAVMEKHGFMAYTKEWWHYTLKDEPFPSTYFDFDVGEPRSSLFI